MANKLSQNIIEHARRLFPKALSYKGRLTIDIKMPKKCAKCPCLWCKDEIARRERMTSNLSQNIIEHAKRVFPNSVSYKGKLTDEQFLEIEKECDIDFYKLVGQVCRYTIRYIDKHKKSEDDD